jgi:mannitol/fructose-specific phosphotransferase system IIA component (Ntr-type)
MKDPTFRKRLMDARTPEEIYDVFSGGDEKGPGGS